MQTITSPLSNVPIFGPDNNKYQRPAFDRLRSFFTGAIKTTKSHYLASAGPGMLVLDFEEKYDKIEKSVLSCKFCVPKTLTDVETIIKWVCADHQKLGITTVGFDTIDELVLGIMLEGLTKEFQSKYSSWKGDDIREFGSSNKGSKGWDIVNGRCLGYFRQLHQAGVGWCAIGHIKEREVTRRKPGGGEEKFTINEPSINDGIKRGLYRAAELIGTTGWKVTETKVPQPPLKLPDGRMLEVPPVSKTAMVPVMRLTQKVGDQDQVVGCNVNLPEEIVLPYGKAYDAVRAEYDKIGQQTGASE